MEEAQFPSLVLGRCEQVSRPNTACAVSRPVSRFDRTGARERLIHPRILASATPQGWMVSPRIRSRNTASRSTSRTSAPASAIAFARSSRPAASDDDQVVLLGVGHPSVGHEAAGAVHVSNFPVGSDLHEQNRPQSDRAQEALRRRGSRVLCRQSDRRECSSASRRRYGGPAERSVRSNIARNRPRTAARPSSRTGSLGKNIVGSEDQQPRTHPSPDSRVH